MEISKQVVTLDLAKRLKELGIKRGKSYFLWEEGDGEMDRGFEWRLVIDDGKSHTFGQKIPAFTAAELGEMLPRETVSILISNTIPGSHSEAHIWVCKSPLDEAEAYDSTEANVRARMLIHLLESNLIPASHRG